MPKLVAAKNLSAFVLQSALQKLWPLKQKAKSRSGLRCSGLHSALGDLQLQDNTCNPKNLQFKGYTH